MARERPSMRRGRLRSSLVERLFACGEPSRKGEIYHE
jgi:hypothetical protein